MHTRLRWATPADAPVLGTMNAALIRDEGHRNPMTAPELIERMRGFLGAGYQALLADGPHAPQGYLLARDDGEHLYLRQLYVIPAARRRGIGRALVDELRCSWGKGRRLRVEVLAGNAPGIAFWRGIGFADYALTLEAPPTPARDEAAGDPPPGTA